MDRPRPAGQQADDRQLVYQNVFGGIYNTYDNSTVGSYLGVVDQSYVTADGGLIMPVGSYNFAYALSVAASTGDTIVGSRPPATCWAARSATT